MSIIPNKLIGSFVGLILFALFAIGQDAGKAQVTPAGYRLGERLTYSMSFQRYENAGFIETYAVSRGKLGDADAVELRMRIKTAGLFSAAFYQLDESRTTFASPDSGNPIFIRRQDNSGVTPRETVTNYMTTPSAGLDLLTLIYKARQSAGAGSFVLAEGDKSYSITFQPTGSEHLRTDAGEFDTTISTVQSDYLNERAIQLFRVNFSNDDAHLPVLIRMKTARGELRIALSGVQAAEPDTAPTPVVIQTPKPTPTPIAVMTPTPVIENQPLSPDLGFELGEALRYRISRGDQRLAEILLQAKERKFVGKQDSLFLSAAVTSAEAGNGYFNAGDVIEAQVSPETLDPFAITLRFSGSLASLNQNVRFDQRSGAVSSGPTRIDAPVGTHCILSLLYAIRSFNLTPSKNVGNPVNDTRVAVYWEGKPHIFTLRPAEPETISVNGQRVLAQKVTVNTGVPQLDQLGLKLWLSADEHRAPLLITLGNFKAELIQRTLSPIK